MAIDRPDFSTMFDASGNALVPAEPASHEALVQEIASADDGTVQKSVPSVPATTPIRDPVTGRINRPDWNKTPAVAHATQTETDGSVPVKTNRSGLPDWGPPRGEDGRFLSRTESQYRDLWSREGGTELAIQRVQQIEQEIVGYSENAQALQAHINRLPRDIMLIAADHLRLTTAHKDSGSKKIDQFLDTLSEAQLATLTTWWRQLSTGDQDLLLGGFSL